MQFETIVVERIEGVGVIRFNRPRVLNALNDQVIAELNTALDGFEKDDGVGCLVVTGGDKAFAAGADIAELGQQTFPAIAVSDFGEAWDRLARVRKPVVAAVAGFALGGGCEIALMCDFIVAADNAKFGQPEIKLGIMPGSGGAARLARFVGRAKALELCLTGRIIDAREAEQWGLVVRVVPVERLMETALESARAIASNSRLAALLLKESIHRSEEGSLSEALRFERRAMQSPFATRDQKEGFAAFQQKRPPNFANE